MTANPRERVSLSRGFSFCLDRFPKKSGTGPFRKSRGGAHKKPGKSCRLFPGLKTPPVSYPNSSSGPTATVIFGVSGYFRKRALTRSSVISRTIFKSSPIGE